MSKCIDDLLRLAREGGDFNKYFDDNDVSLVDFARFVEKAEQGDIAIWRNAYQSIRDYFRGEKGDDILRNFLQSDIRNKEDYYVLSNLIRNHPSHNRIFRLSMEHKDDFEKYLSSRDKLYMEASKKLRAARERYSDYPSQKCTAIRENIDDVRQKASERSNPQPRNDEAQQQKCKRAKGQKEVIGESSLDQVLRKRYEDLHKR